MPDPGARPYVILSCAMSVDGCIDTAGGERLILSGPSDLDRVDDLRASCDAILVGAGTVRRDNPRLLVRSAERRARRVARGLPASPDRIVLTESVDLDPDAAVFTGDATTVVVCPAPAAPAARELLGHLAVIADVDGTSVPVAVVRRYLASRGVRRLLVEGGAEVLSAFLAAGLTDELHLVVAPFFVGEADAPRFALPALYPHDADRPMTLAEARPVGACVLLRYLLDGAAGATLDAQSAADRRWLRAAIGLSRRCPPSTTAFSVGAIVVDAAGDVLATGYSRETDPHDHAEEVALAKIAPGDPRLTGATVYSSLEPCSTRASRPRTCTELILAAGVGRVVFAWREPELFADCVGAELLRAGGVEVAEMRDLADGVREVNAHLS